MRPGIFRRLGAAEGHPAFGHRRFYASGLARGAEGKTHSRRRRVVYTPVSYTHLKERGAVKQAVAKDFLTSDELPAYEKKEAAVAVLLDAGLRYEQIKPIVLKGG